MFVAINDLTTGAALCFAQFSAAVTCQCQLFRLPHGSWSRAGGVSGPGLRAKAGRSKRPRTPGGTQKARRARRRRRRNIWLSRCCAFLFSLFVVVIHTANRYPVRWCGRSARAGEGKDNGSPQPESRRLGLAEESVVKKTTPLILDEGSSLRVLQQQ